MNPFNANYIVIENGSLLRLPVHTASQSVLATFPLLQPTNVSVRMTSAAPQYHCLSSPDRLRLSVRFRLYLGVYSFEVYWFCRRLCRLSHLVEANAEGFHILEFLTLVQAFFRCFIGTIPRHKIRRAEESNDFLFFFGMVWYG